VVRTRGNAWWARQDSNLQPDRYERPALTIELQAPPAVPLTRQATVRTPLTMRLVIRQSRDFAAVISTRRVIPGRAKRTSDVRLHIGGLVLRTIPE
jgi:hypothetical protein